MLLQYQQLPRDDAWKAIKSLNFVCKTCWEAVSFARHHDFIEKIRFFAVTVGSPLHFRFSIEYPTLTGSVHKAFLVPLFSLEVSKDGPANTENWNDQHSQCELSKQSIHPSVITIHRWIQSYRSRPIYATCNPPCRMKVIQAVSHKTRVHSLEVLYRLIPYRRMSQPMRNVAPLHSRNRHGDP